MSPSLPLPSAHQRARHVIHPFLKNNLFKEQKKKKKKGNSLKRLFAASFTPSDLLIFSNPSEQPCIRLRSFPTILLDGDHKTPLNNPRVNLFSSPLFLNFQFSWIALLCIINISKLLLISLLKWSALIHIWSTHQACTGEWMWKDTLYLQKNAKGKLKIYSNTEILSINFKKIIFLGMEKKGAFHYF